ncbi:unnamed protein product [Rhizoctonia solani]|uniref:Uncharacterized protein n=1 Tax=Rhizoctonia solani TaxID=456999 RepID=A0A8H3HLN9_9AGAM|nr:unnamed protein product [Rhizoctonia solani]
MAQTENDIQQAVQLIHTFVDRLPLFLRDHETNNGLPAEISDNFKQLETQIERTNHLVLESINSSNRRFDEMLKSSNKRFDDIIKSSNKRFDEIKEEFDDIRARMEYYNRLAHVRSLNSSAHIDEGPIYPLPLANGENPPPEDLMFTILGSSM